LHAGGETVAANCSCDLPPGVLWRDVAANGLEQLLVTMRVGDSEQDWLQELAQ
jgi:hypothetical protein